MSIHCNHKMDSALFISAKEMELFLRMEKLLAEGYTLR